ncbi:MAG: flap endonuclease-1 [Methanocellales archaeon]
MGVDLGDLIKREEIELDELANCIVAIDAHNTLYQFLSIIRQPNGTPLMNSKGRITSHLSGLIYRTTNLMEMGIKPVFVFDGKPPEFKQIALEERSLIKQKAEAAWIEAKAYGIEGFKYAQAASRLTQEMIGEAKTLLKYLGIPVVQAPSEGEAQASYIVLNGDADYTASQDYDSLLFGSPKLVRNLTITGKRKLPSKNIYVEVKPERIELQEVLKQLEIAREQLIEIGILIGTDYNEGIKGIGPKKALKLIKKHGSIEGVFEELNQSIANWREIKEYLLHPQVTSDYEIKFNPPNSREIKQFLCEEHSFSEERIDKILERLSLLRETFKQRTLNQW